MKLLLSLLILLTSSSMASVLTAKGDKIVFSSSEFKLSELITDYAKLNTMNLIFDSDFKDQSTTLVGTKTIDKTDFALYISMVLMDAGYVMIPVAETQTINVIAARDIRYRSSKIYKDINSLPDTFEHVWFLHTLKHIPAGIVARNMRPLASRYGRIIDHTDSIMISDTAKNVKLMMQIISVMDTPEHLKGWEEIQKLNEKNKKVLTKSKGILDILGDNTVIFLVLFCLIGGIIGFGTRSYMMKRIEGGW